MEHKQNKVTIEKPVSLKPAVLGLIAQFLFFIFHALIGSWTHSSPVELNSYFILLGCGFWFLALLHTFFKAKAIEEKNELIRVENIRLERGAKSSLFQNNEIINNSFQQNFLKYEKYFLPILCFIFSLLLMGFGFQIYREYKFLSVFEVPINIFKACAFIAGISFLLLMLGLYVRALAEGGQAFLRGPGTMMLTSAILCVVEAGSLIAFTSGWVENLNILYFIGIILCFTVGVELLLNTFLFIIKPVHANETKIPPYDSRIFLLLTSTGSAWQSINAMIDYQFGFKVSESWFYKTLLKLVIPFLLFQIAAGLLCTSFVMINAGSVGVIERFGKPQNVGEPLQPGLHFKLPWPIENVNKVNIREVKSLEVGHKNDDHDAIASAQKGVLSHYEETDLFAVRRHAISNQDETYMEMISISASILYSPNLKNLESYLYQYKSTEDVLKMLLHSELSMFLSEKTIGQNFAVVVTDWNNEFSSRFINKAKLIVPGVLIEYVTLQNIHVPAELSDAVNEKFISSEKRKTESLNAKTEVVKLETQTDQEVAVLKNTGLQDINRIDLVAKVESKRVANISDLYKKYGAIFKQREFLEMIENYLSISKIDFVSSNTKIMLEDSDKTPNALESFKE